MFRRLWCREQNEKEPYGKIGSSISAISMEVREADVEERRAGRRRKKQGESWRENVEGRRRDVERTGGLMNKGGSEWD